MTPHEVDELGLWLDARDLSSLGHETPVTYWPDKSGNRRDAIFAKVLENPNHEPHIFYHNPPTLNLYGPNQLPAIAFDSEKRQSLILTPPGRSLDTNVPGLTFILVSKSSNTTSIGSSYIFLTHTDPDIKVAGARFATVRNTTPRNGNVMLHLRGQTSDNLQAVESPTEVIPDMEWGIYSAVVDYQNGHANQFYNGRLWITGGHGICHRV